MQVTAQAHALLQFVVLAQLPSPEQLTVHRLVPHVMAFAHDALPVQLMTHSEAAVQSTPPAHDEPPSQLTSQRMPGGHSIVEEHALAAQVNTHEPDMHVPPSLVHA